MEIYVLLNKIENKTKQKEKEIVINYVIKEFIEAFYYYYCNY
jgi:hypothetical protein